jgi:hypothetical protein
MLAVWQECYAQLQTEWFKVEALQDYSGQDRDNASLRAWMAGDTNESMRLLEADTYWSEGLQQKRAAGVLMRRVRVTKTPYTPYLQWEMEYYKRKCIPYGEQILVVDHEALGNLTLPGGNDMSLFDDRIALVPHYDAMGYLRSGDIYTDNENIEQFVRLKEALVALVQPL